MKGSPEFLHAYQGMVDKTNELLYKYYDDVEKLSSKSDFKACLKEFFNLTNAVRNATAKEINSLESLLHKDLRGDPIYKNSEFKELLNKEYPAVKKAFVDQDSYLRKKVSEVLNAPKQ